MFVHTDCAHIWAHCAIIQSMNFAVCKVKKHGNWIWAHFSANMAPSPNAALASLLALANASSSSSSVREHTWNYSCTLIHLPIRHNIRNSRKNLTDRKNNRHLFQHRITVQIAESKRARQAYQGGFKSCVSPARTTRIPRPPPPKAAFRMMGNPAILANACASSVVVIECSVPGTTGTPQAVAMARAVVLSPINCEQRTCSESESWCPTDCQPNRESMVRPRFERRTKHWLTQELNLRWRSLRGSRTPGGYSPRPDPWQDSGCLQRTHAKMKRMSDHQN